MSYSPETGPAITPAAPAEVASGANPAASDSAARKDRDPRGGRSRRPGSREGTYRESRGGPVDGIVYIYATFNNTLSTFVDSQGNTKAWANAGEDNRGAKRSTPYAASGVAKRLVQRVKDKNLRVSRVNVIVKGAGRGSIDAFLKELHRTFEICMLEDRTPLPHNGCRPPKKRRV